MSLISLFTYISSVFRNWCIHLIKYLTFTSLDKEMHNLHWVLDIREGIEVPDVADKHSHSSYKQEML